MADGYRPDAMSHEPLAMSELLPLFPLPNVVLFPNVFQPLHIFEERYRDMVRDALDSDRLIGMVLLRQGWEREYEAAPPIYPIGCSGVITHADKLADGRYNIVLRGVERFRILDEDRSRSYRRARVEPMRERDLCRDDHAEIRRQRSKLEALLAPAVERAGADTRIPAGMSDEDLINALAQYLDFEPVEKQALLEHQCLRSRAQSLVELLEMRALISGTPGFRPVAH
jgi:hypothetical protein